MQQALETTHPLLLSQPHACSYLPDKTARMLFVNKDSVPSKHIYSRLAAQGFRRSGQLLYRPACEHCHACIPVRIPVSDFSPNRTQRKTWQRNQDVDVRIHTPELTDEHYRLYQSYLNWRHPNETRFQTPASDYAALLAGQATCCIEFRIQSRLVCVAVTDILIDALSSIYTYYEPELHNRSLGTFSILWQIDAARRRNHHWLYIGYWIAASKKMAYKDRFRPFEKLTEHGWGRVE
ncbi:MAG: arginyltransferase [Gammaproteobacteria bacterium]|nr:arginyltransferase [Gammaproteobacteria bacterium]MDE2345843.1 arginyltransferase [Gammaproteobacteria bacterium]